MIYGFDGFGQADRINDLFVNPVSYYGIFWVILL